MHDATETQEIVEAFAEHDFYGLRLSGMIRASGCSADCFYAHCQHIKKHWAFDTRIYINILYWNEKVNKYNYKL